MSKTLYEKYRHAAKLAARGFFKRGGACASPCLACAVEGAKLEYATDVESYLGETEHREWGGIGHRVLALLLLAEVTRQ